MSAAEPEPSSTTPAAATAAEPLGPVIAAPTGERGAVHFDDGYVQIGSGPKTVDLFVDFMCPYCQLFEQTSGTALFEDAAAGRTTLRVHPLAMLNRLSQGTDYSTRAAALFTAVSAEQPEASQAFLQALYAAQPEENSPGLSDDELRAIAESAGVAEAASSVSVAPYSTWVDEHTETALTGPLVATTEIPAIEHVPTVVVNGAVFTGNSDEAEKFAAFYRDN